MSSGCKYQAVCKHSPRLLGAYACRAVPTLHLEPSLPDSRPRYLSRIETHRPRKLYYTMASSGTVSDWVTWAFSPAISAIIVTILISLLLPVALHYFLHRKASSKILPSFVLIGPSGSGKTTLLTLVKLTKVMSEKNLANRRAVRERLSISNSYEPSASIRTLSASVRHTLFRRSIQVGARYFRAHSAEVSTT